MKASPESRCPKFEEQLAQTRHGEKLIIWDARILFHRNKESQGRGSAEITGCAPEYAATRLQELGFNVPPTAYGSPLLKPISLTTKYRRPAAEIFPRRRRTLFATSPSHLQESKWKRRSRNSLPVVRHTICSEMNCDEFQEKHFV